MADQQHGDVFDRIAKAQDNLSEQISSLTDAVRSQMDMQKKFRQEDKQTAFENKRQREAQQMAADEKAKRDKVGGDQLNLQNILKRLGQSTLVERVVENMKPHANRWDRNLKMGHDFIWNGGEWNIERREGPGVFTRVGNGIDDVVRKTENAAGRVKATLTGDTDWEPQPKPERQQQSSEPRTDNRNVRQPQQPPVAPSQAAPAPSTASPSSAPSPGPSVAPTASSGNSNAQAAAQRREQQTQAAMSSRQQTGHGQAAPGVPPTAQAAPTGFPSASERGGPVPRARHAEQAQVPVYDTANTQVGWTDRGFAEAQHAAAQGPSAQGLGEGSTPDSPTQTAQPTANEAAMGAASGGGVAAAAAGGAGGGGGSVVEDTNEGPSPEGGGGGAGAGGGLIGGFMGGAAGGFVSKGMSMINPLHIQGEITNWRDKGAFFQGLSGEGTGAAAEDWANMQLWTSTPALTGRGAGGLFNRQEALSLYQGVTKLGANDRDATGGEDRTDMLNYALAAKRNYGQSAGESLSQLQLFSENPLDNSLGADEASLYSTTKAAGAAGVNGAMARNMQMSYYAQGLASGDNGAMGTDQAIAQSVVAGGRGYAQTTDASNRANMQSGYSRQVAARLGMTQAQYALAQNDPKKKAAIAAAQQSVAGDAMGMIPGGKEHVQAYKKAHPDASVTDQARDLENWSVNSGAVPDLGAFSAAMSVRTGNTYTDPFNAFEDYVNTANGQFGTTKDWGSSKAGKSGTNGDKEHQSATPFNPSQKATSKDVARMAEDQVPMLKTLRQVGELDSAVKDVVGINGTKGQITRAAKLAVAAEGATTGPNAKGEVDKNGTDSSWQLKGSVADDKKKGGGQTTSTEDSIFQMLGLAAKTQDKYVVDLSPDAKKLLKLISVSGQDAGAAARAATSGNPLMPTTDGSR